MPYEPTSRPVEESLVDLWLVGPGGDSVRYDPTGLAGEFAAAAAVSANEAYRLSGTIASRAVTAQVSMPGTLVVGRPAADTLRYPSTTPYPSIRFAWRAASAASYQALLVHDDGTSHTGYIVRPGDFSGRVFDIVPDTTGELQIFAPSPGEPDTARLRILGYDRTATAFFSSTTKGNVHGAFGLFGAAAQTEKVIVWE